MGSRLVELAKSEGVRDLPMAVKHKFAQALTAEEEGNDERAAELLEMAIEAEITKNNAKE
jgi:hypothetical protein